MFLFFFGKVPALSFALLEAGVPLLLGLRCQRCPTGGLPGVQPTLDGPTDDEGGGALDVEGLWGTTLTLYCCVGGKHYVVVLISGVSEL